MGLVELDLRFLIGSVVLRGLHRYYLGLVKQLALSRAAMR